MFVFGFSSNIQVCGKNLKCLVEDLSKMARYVNDGSDVIITLKPF